MEPKRNFDNGSWLLSFADEVWVICPKCHSPGRINGNSYYKEWHGKFFCPSCSLILDTKKDYWKGPALLTGRRPCGNCGHQWVEVKLKYPQYDQSVPVEQGGICSVCRKVSIVSCKWDAASPPDSGVDPFFGLPLYLKTDCKHGVIWAFNLNHIKSYRDFINADLRERQGTPKWSWITRLPKWIKSSKNREPVLKALDKMEGAYNKANAADAKSRAAD